MLKMMGPPDPEKLWTAFVDNMSATIKRVVAFVKLLPGMTIYAYVVIILVFVVIIIIIIVIVIVIVVVVVIIVITITITITTLPSSPWPPVHHNQHQHRHNIVIGNVIVIAMTNHFDCHHHFYYQHHQHCMQPPPTLASAVAATTIPSYLFYGYLKHTIQYMCNIICIVLSFIDVRH